MFRFQIRLVIITCVVAGGCVLPPSGPAMRGGPSRSPTARNVRPDAPDLKKLSNGHYRVRKPWTVVVNGRTWQVQKGYSSNGITAPGVMKNQLGDGIQHPETWAAVFHDWLFTQPGISRQEADKVFHDLLIAYGVPGSKASLMYTTVSAYSLTKSKP